MKHPIPLRYTIPGTLLFLGFALTALSAWYEGQSSELLAGNLSRAGLMAGVALILTLLTWWYFERTLTQRAARLVDATRALAAGDFTARARVTGGDELAQLADAFNRMAAELEQNQVAVEKAHASAQLFRSLVERVHDAIEIFDPDTGCILDMNERGCLDLGYSREEVTALRIPDINPMITPESFRHNVDVLRKTGSLNMEGMHRRKDGTTFPVEKSISWVRLDREYLVAVVRDVTARRLEDQARRTLATERAAIVDAAMDGIICMDSEGCITTFNPAAERIFGCRSSQVAGHSLAPAIRPPGTLARLLEELAPKSETAPTGQTEVRRVEAFGLRIDGREIPLELSVSRMPGAGSPIFTVFVRDITQRREAEAQVQMARQEAERHLALLGASLDNLREGVVISDLQGNVYYWNRAALEMHGYASLDECRRHIREFATVYEMADGEGRVWPLDQWPLMRVLRGESLQELPVIVRRRADGWERYCCYSGTLARTAAGQPLLAVLSIADITARLRTESRLAEERQRFHDLFEHSPVATWLEDCTALAAWMQQLRDAGVPSLRNYLEQSPSAISQALSLIRILDLNPAAVRQNAGRSKQEVIDNLPRLFDDAARASFAEVLDALWHGETSLRYETRSRRLDGSPLQLIVQLDIPVHGGGPDYSHVIVTGTETTRCMDDDLSGALSGMEAETPMPGGRSWRPSRPAP